MTKILLGVVTHSKQKYCLDEFIECLKNQTVKTDVLFVVNNGESAYAKLINSKGFKAMEDPKQGNTRIEKIVNGRKFLREYALKNNYDFLMFVDSDVMLPPNAVELMSAARIDVLTGIYLNAFELDGKKVIAPVVFKDLGGGNCQLYTAEAVLPNKVMEIGAAGLGCTMISRRVLEKIDFRTFGNSTTGGEDMAFYVDARAAGFKTVATTFVKCVHRPFPKDDRRARLFEWHKQVQEFTHRMRY